MPTVTRFPFGVGNVLPKSPMADLPIPDPLSLAAYADDFFRFASAEWSTTLSVGTPTFALTAGAGGLLALTTDATAIGDSAYLAKAPASFGLVAGKRAWFRASVQPSDVGARVLAGVTDTTTAFAPTNGAWFSTAAGGTGALTFNVAVGGTVSSLTLAQTLSATALTDLAWALDTKGTFAAFVGGVQVGHLTPSGLPSGTLSLVAAISTQAAAAKSLTLDYLMAAVAR